MALVHDWLTGMRGGEKVLEAIAELYPDATIHTLLHVKGSVSKPLESHPERRSFVQWLPSAARHYRQYLPLFPIAIEQFDFDPYDLVISTSHCAAKSVVVPGRARHVCYCHSPMRYAWDQFASYFGPDQVGPTRSRLLRPVLARLARWDRDTAGRVDRYVANSHYVAGRIRRYYNRGSTVVYPPVDTAFYRPDQARSPEPFFLAVSALVPYKRLDVAIQAAALTNASLTIVGRGPEELRLRRLAEKTGGKVEFAGWLEDDDIRTAYQRCRAVLMPGIEDFGMVPVEAQACGRPVVALAAGGALESVVDGVTGILVRDSSVNAFAAAMADAASRDFDSAAIRRHAESFGKARFHAEFRAVVDATDSGCRGSREDDRDAAPRRSSDPIDVSNAARYAQDPTHSGFRSSREDDRDAAPRRSRDPVDVSNAARYAQDCRNPAVREKKQ
ncbi:MAG TPA: glycosyltransferase [Vicinamibacterales bacterium]|nr:glycosyltransferase [Vicinamibacterales bacterium]